LIKECGHLGIRFSGQVRLNADEENVILNRHELSDEQCERVHPPPPGKVGDHGCSAAANRKILDAILCIAGTGAQWRASASEL